jgi:hypothetical protein
MTTRPRRPLECSSYVMRPEPNAKLDRHRIVHPTLGSSPAGANWGAFLIHRGPITLAVISSGSHNAGAEGERWEHVSVSTAVRCPTWDELCYVKHLFWRDDEAVCQFHPPRAVYINCHKFCLHLWRPLDWPLRLPPSMLVGPSSLTTAR